MAEFVESWDSQYVVRGGELSLSNPGQRDLLLAAVDRGMQLRTASRGFSMHPFICDRDILTISPIRGMQPSVGDIVAFTDAVTGKLTVHRIVGQRNGGWLVKGDNCTAPDGVVATEQVIGRVCRVERGGREVSFGIQKAGRLIATLNGGHALWCLKSLRFLTRHAAGRLLQGVQGLSAYRRFLKLVGPHIAISAADADDMEAVHRMFNRTVPYHPQSQDPNGTNWVAKWKGKVVGFAQTVDHPEENHPWIGHWLFLLHVRPLCRGAGIGARLAIRAVDQVRRQNAGEIFLAVFEDDRRALRLYRHLGFDRVTLLALEALLAEEMLETGRRRIVMRKDLR